MPDIRTVGTSRAHADGVALREQLLNLRLEAARKRRLSIHMISPRRASERPLPLSHAQERLWFLDQMGLVGAAYNTPLALRLSGEVNERALERSFLELLRRHESLRTRFGVQAGIPHQLIDPPGPFELHRADFTDISDPQRREQTLYELMRREQLQHFNLSEGPLLRVVLVRLASLEHALLITMHHIVTDGWSIGVLVRELRTLYAAYVRGEPSPLPNLPVQYADYAIWQREWLQGALLESQLKYWSERLAGAPPQLQLPTDRPRPATESFKGGMLRFHLPATLTGALEELARREGATLFMVILAAYQVFLSRWSGQEDIVVGTPIAGRKSRQVEGLIGFFVNTLALRTDVSGHLSFRQLLERTKEVTLEAYAHQDLPFEVLVKELRPERNLARQPIVQVVLALQNYPEEHPDLAGLTWSWSSVEYATTHFDLTLYLYEDPDGLSGTMEYAADLFDLETIERMVSHFRTLLEQIVAAPDCPIHAVSLLSDAEKHQLLVEWNGTAATSYPHGKLIHELFEAQVEGTPNAVAVTYEGQSLTYTELNARANQLARYLRNKGVGPDELVALSVERNLNLVVGLLGILKAGGAYVPLDPNNPTERLGYMLSDASPRMLIIEEHLRDRLPETTAEVISLDNHWNEIAQQDSSNVDVSIPGLRTDHLAYVIYTSGSTGEPKGVMVEHRNVTRLFAATAQWFQFSERDVWTLFHSFAFDFSVWELWGALLHGGRVVVVPSLTARSPQEFYRLLCVEGVTVLNQTPSAFAQLIDAQAQSAEKHSLRVVIFGGEALELRTLQPWVERNGAERPKLVNMYGITETTVHVTYQPLANEEIESERGSLVGTPIPDLRVYLLDKHRQLVPIGVAGEIYVGGAGVARGYLNRPALTAERFIADPYSGDPRARLYKTGDLGRWRSGGAIEYLGRNDHQVKIRGYRVELGEIESVLLDHPAVKQSIVLARGDTPDERRLVAYVVGNRDIIPEATAPGMTDTRRNEILREWESIYEDIYATANQPGPSFVGWNSSYTGEPIPDAQMQEWLASTVTRIKALQPNRVLEIGCGVGLLLQHLAPQCAAYVGTDISASALRHLQQWTRRRDYLKHVELLHRSATDLQDLTSGSFDTVVLNSVVQYFPDIQYLLAVLQEAVRLLSPDGKIFVGDVRHLGLLQMFHSAVQLSKAAATVTVGQLRKRIARAVTQDKELLIDPQFFQILPGQLPGISAVEVQLKRGLAPNELTRYRYDVVMHIGEQSVGRVVCDPQEWKAAIESAEEIESALRTGCWSAVRLMSIPNSRLAREAEAQRLIETSDARLQAGALRRQLGDLRFEAADPEMFWKLGQSFGYDVQVGWTANESPVAFEVQLLDFARVDQRLRVVSEPVDTAATCSSYANNPSDSAFTQQLIPRLREYLEARLPEYMIPSAWVTLKEMPLTANGKLDRHALPAPQSWFEEMGEFVAPRTDLERSLVEIWAQVLGVDQVGVQDDFFELGGHSLLVIKALFKINQSFKCSLGVTDMYRSPTIHALAERICEGAIPEEFVELSYESVLDEEIIAKSGVCRVPPKSIMLTGATGFVGRFLLAQLLKDTDATIYCLVRAPSEEQARSHLTTTLLKWDLWRDGFERRIVAIPGHLELPHLGLNARTYEVVAQNVDSIYHCASSMNHLETYEMAKQANVEGARELVKLATRHQPKLINYVSTLGIFTTTGLGTTRVANEASNIDNERHSTASGYVASKWVAEKMFMIAGDRGIPCNIFRVGLVWADTQQGRYDELQREYRIFKSCLLSGCGIENYQHQMPPTPVDYVARSIAFLANKHFQGRHIFHISSAGQMAEGVFERCNTVANTSLKLMPMYDWICEMKRLHQQGRSLPIVPLIEFAFSMDEGSFCDRERRNRAASVRVDCTRTHCALEEAGIVAPALNDDLIRKCLSNMLSRDLDLQGQLIDCKGNVMHATRDGALTRHG